MFTALTRGEENNRAVSYLSACNNERVLINERGLAVEMCASQDLAWKWSERFQRTGGLVVPIRLIESV
jgi:hypothetical protein